MSAKKKLPPKDVFSDEGVKRGEHYATALLENIQDQVKSIAESLDLTRTDLASKIEDARSELKQEIEVTQRALEFVNKELTEKIDGVEQRLTRVEAKLDSVVEKVDHYDKDITHLKSAVFPT